MTIQRTDFLVIGSGIAGLNFAINASQYGKVVIITKKSDTDSNSNRAQGGIACVLDPTDHFSKHIDDTLATGKGLSNRDAVEILVKEGPERIKELLDWGVHFTRSPESRAFAHLDLGREGGHTAHRIVHAKDLTGQEVESALLSLATHLSNITLYQDHYAVELITNHQVKKPPKKNRCYGAYVLDTKKNRIFPLRAKITCLATGGLGKSYRHTTNPEIATGDGIAMAWRAGAEIRNMEFIQFHPTMLYNEKADSFLISEAMRGFGAVIKNRKGTRFMDSYHPMKSLAPRDVVAQAIDKEMKKTGEPCVYLDITHMPAPKTRKRFPNIYERCKAVGIDITNELVPVVPAAHYLCGGIRVDTCSRSSIGNLYACGENSCTGVHGANRLASNSLLEALVFSRRAVTDARQRISSIPFVDKERIPPWDESGTADTEEWILLSHNLQEIQSTMWDYVGIVRSNLRLQRALRRIRFLNREIEDYYKRTKITPSLLDLRNVVTNALLIASSALRRHESRGLHFTTDYPVPDNRYWKKDSIVPPHAHL
ncbi:MAG: L-aspartate oxidase [Chitinivibrionales bacterium]|nr:L-aspartate oxidase [Chitinivibrionales bacterium]